MRRMITGKDAEIFKNVTADGNKTVVSGDLDVSGNILKNGQPLGGKQKITLNVFSQTDAANGWTTLSSLSAYESQLQNIKVGDPITIIVKHNNDLKNTVNLVCTTNEIPFTGMGQHFMCYGAGYTDNASTENVCSCYIDFASSGQDGPKLYLSNTSSTVTQYNTTLVKNDKVEIYF